MAILTSNTIPTFPATNFYDIPMRLEFTIQVSNPTRISPSNIWLRPNLLSKKPIPHLRICSTTTSPDELQEIPADFWVGLLDPMDPCLRVGLLHYEEMAQTYYVGINLINGGCKYTQEEFFIVVDLETCGCCLTRYLYITQETSSDSTSALIKKLDYVGRKKEIWVGYVAVSNDDSSTQMGRRDIAIVFRGLCSNFDWIANYAGMMLNKCNGVPCLDPAAKVVSGFERLYTSDNNNNGSPREQVYLKTLVS